MYFKLILLIYIVYNNPFLTNIIHVLSCIFAICLCNIGKGQSKRDTYKFWGNMCIVNNDYCCDNNIHNYKYSIKEIGAALGSYYMSAFLGVNISKLFK